MTARKKNLKLLRGKGVNSTGPPKIERARVGPKNPELDYVRVLIDIDRLPFLLELRVTSPPEEKK